MLSKTDFQEFFHATKDRHKVWSCHVTKGCFVGMCWLEICLPYHFHMWGIFCPSVILKVTTIFFQIQIWSWYVWEIILIQWVPEWILPYINTMEKYAAKGREHNLLICRSESLHDARGAGSFGWQVARLSAKEKALLLAVFLTEACNLSSGISQLKSQLVICLLLHWEAAHMSTEAAMLAVKHCNTLACILLYNQIFMLLKEM